MTFTTLAFVLNAVCESLSIWTINCDILIQLSMSFLRSPVSLVEFINEEKSCSLKLVKYENPRTH